MTTRRPGLTDPTGHSAIITAVPLTVETVQSLIQSQTTTVKEEVLGEITLTVPTRTGVVSSFNGLTGDVVGVSSFNGSTGGVVFAVDGGSYS